IEALLEASHISEVCEYSVGIFCWKGGAVEVGVWSPSCAGAFVPKACLEGYLARVYLLIVGILVVGITPTYATVQPSIPGSGATCEIQRRRGRRNRRRQRRRRQCRPARRSPLRS